MIQAASQVATSISHLKSKYLKYLETLCSANGIDISTLKSNGSDIRYIEIFFGGLPVLVGLKYFTNVTVLKIFGQNITCVKSLFEVSGTLEELWLCEGRLKDLSGLDACTKLRKLYLYENHIEDASPLSSLTNLEYLHLEMNRLKCLAFLQPLTRLVHLQLGGNKMRDAEFATISHWPAKLQFLDIGGNHIRRPQVLIPLSACASLRHLSISSPQFQASHLVENNLFLEWVAHSFRFIECLDDDDVSEQFTTLYLPQTESRVAETMNHCLKLKEHEEQEIKAKLSKLCDALQKLNETLPSKDGRREVVKRVLDVAHTNLKSLKATKKSFKTLLNFHITIQRYIVAMNLECCGVPGVRNSESEEIDILNRFLNQNSSAKQSFEISVMHSVTTRAFHKSDCDKLFILDRNQNSRLHDIRSIMDLLDHHFRTEYRTAIRIFKDFQLIKKEANEKTAVFYLPIVYCKPASHSTHPDASDKKNEENLEVKSNEHITWSNLRLVAICAVEVRYVGMLHTDHQRHMDQFDASFEEQQKKLKEMSIKVDLKDDKLQKKFTEETTDATIDTIANKASKVRCVREVLNHQQLVTRYSCSPGYFNVLRVRNPIDLVLSYGNQTMTADLTDSLMKITTLDLSGMKLTKLSGIEELQNLAFLSIKGNKISSMSKLHILQCLQYLDASGNHISKLENLPSSLIDLRLAENRLSSLHFCESLQILEHLDVSSNHIKNLSGIEHCKLLEILWASNNPIKEKTELETLKCCSNLWFVDFTNCPLSTIDGYKTKMHVNFPYLLSLDREMILLEEKHLAHKRTGRSLTVEMIEKCYPDWTDMERFSLCDHKLQVIGLENSCLLRLSHLVSLDLSSNLLESVKELGGLSSLKVLILNRNAVRVVCSTVQENNETTNFPCLEELDLSENEISQSIFARLGLQNLKNLKALSLSGNSLSRTDAPLFDLPSLIQLDLSDNQIKYITRKQFPSLLTMNLDKNRLKTLDGLVAPKLEKLDVGNNKLSTCAGLKPISTFPQLAELECTGNTVTEKRVYIDYVKSQAPALQILDGLPIRDHLGLPEVRNHRMSIASIDNRDNSVDNMLINSQFLSASSYDLTRSSSPSSYSDWLLPEDFNPRKSNSNLSSRRNSSWMSLESMKSESPEFMIQGVRATKHRKL